VDANVSVRRAGETALGTKTEVKNINSFAYVEKALTVERIARSPCSRAGHRRPADHAVRLEDEQRAAAAQQGREPRLPLLPGPRLHRSCVTEEFIAEQQTLLPELPRKSASASSRSTALSVTDAAVLTADRTVADYYEAVVHAGADAKTAANWVMTEVLEDAKDHADGLRVLPVPLRI